MTSREDLGESEVANVQKVTATHFSTGIDFEDGQSSLQRMNAACGCTVPATDEPGCYPIAHAKYPFWDRGCVQFNKCILCYMWVTFFCAVVNM